MLVAAMLGAGAAGAQRPAPANLPGSELTVYLMTIGQGDQVWERYGHNAIGIRKHGAAYVLHFMGPSFFEVQLFGRHFHVRPLAPLFLPLELILHFARILTLSVRLLANMFADHTVVSVWIGLLPVVVPAIFMGLGLLVAVLQAFVFSLLTMIYIGEALAHPH